MNRKEGRLKIIWEVVLGMIVGVILIAAIYSGNKITSIYKGNIEYAYYKITEQILLYISKIEDELIKV